MLQVKITRKLKVYTEKQKSLLQLLADGLPHRVRDVKVHLGYDEFDSKAAMHMQVSNLRKLLRPQGQDIICEYRERSYWYRQVRLLASAYNGKR